MAITNTILLKGLLGAVVCLGSASAAIANRGKIVSYFSKDKDDKKANGADSKKPKGDGKTQNAESTTPSDKGATENSPSTTPNDTGTDTGKTANGGQGSKATPGGAGANTGQAKTTGPGADTTTGQGVGSTGGQGTQGQPGPSQSTQTNTEHEEINKKIGDLKLPDGCKFDSSVKDNTKECNLTEEQLKKVNFKNKGSGDLTIDGASGGLKLEIKALNKDNNGEDTKKYGNNFSKNDLRFTFKELKEDVKIKKDGSDSNPIVLKKGTDPELEIYFGNSKLYFYWYLSLLAKKVGLNCTDSSNSITCTPLSVNNQQTKINLIDSDEIKEIKIEDSDKSKEITVLKDQENYNQGFKFTVPSGGIKGKENAGDLAEGDYEIKYIDKKGWGLSKKTAVAR